MFKKNKALFVATIILTLYFVLSIPYYYVERDSLEGFPIIMSFYLGFIVVHEAFILLALAFQWLGLLKAKKGLIRFAAILMILGALELCLLLVPVVFLLPLAIIDFAKSNFETDIKE